MVDEFGRNVYGEPKTGAALEEGKALMKRGTSTCRCWTPRSRSCARRSCYTFPDCTTKTIEELRKPKLDAWNRNKENSRAWLR
jgi:6-oxo-cyclohex-1-ene-carbonyl-CoA hydrolase